MDFGCQDQGCHFCCDYFSFHVAAPFLLLQMTQEMFAGSRRLVSVHLFFDRADRNAPSAMFFENGNRKVSFLIDRRPLLREFASVGSEQVS